MKSEYAFSIHVDTEYLEDQSQPESDRYAFSYTVTITNTGNIAAQLVSRHWVIHNALGDIQEVKGLGVVGAQPIIEPGQQYVYTSGTVLTTPSGKMHGQYQCVAVDGTWFKSDIPEFHLSQPRTLH